MSEDKEHKAMSEDKEHKAGWKHFLQCGLTMRDYTAYDWGAISKTDFTTIVRPALKRYFGISEGQPFVDKCPRCCPTFTGLRPSESEILVCDACAGTGLFTTNTDEIPMLLKYIMTYPRTGDEGDHSRAQFAVYARWEAHRARRAIPEQGLLFMSRDHEWELAGATSLARAAFETFNGSWRRSSSGGVRLPLNARRDATPFVWRFNMKPARPMWWSENGEDPDDRFLLKEGHGGIVPERQVIEELSRWVRDGEVFNIKKEQWFPSDLPMGSGDPLSPRSGKGNW